MKKYLPALILGFLLSSTQLHAQYFTLRPYFDLGVGHINWIVYDYTYEEFDEKAPGDSSVVLNSFRGELTVNTDSRDFSDYAVVYGLHIIKEGLQIKRTFFDTLSVDTVKMEYKDTVNVRYGFDAPEGSDGYIHGWIFPDTLYESTGDSVNGIPPYPYGRLYEFYNLDDNDSVYHTQDTMYISYRPKTIDRLGSYYAVDYILGTDWEERSYSRYYALSGAGFQERYTYKYGFWAAIEEDDESVIQPQVELFQNYPNPFNPATTIRFSLRNRMHVKLAVYDILGSEVMTLFEGVKNPGDHKVVFDAARLASGAYFYKLSSEQHTITRKCLFVK